MAKRVTVQPAQKGEAIVDYEEKVFPEYEAKPGERALFLIHTVPYEGSVGAVNLLTAMRTKRKGYDVSIIFYGPGSSIPVYRGWPKIGEDGYGIGIQGLPNLVERLIAQGVKIYACRFSASALQGHREDDFIAGVKLIHPTDILDLVIEHHRAGALIFNTWTV